MDLWHRTVGLTDFYNDILSKHLLICMGRVTLLYHVVTPNAWNRFETNERNSTSPISTTWMNPAYFFEWASQDVPQWIENTWHRAWHWFLQTQSACHYRSGLQCRWVSFTSCVLYWINQGTAMFSDQTLQHWESALLVPEEWLYGLEWLWSLDQMVV